MFKIQIFKTKKEKEKEKQKKHGRDAHATHKKKSSMLGLVKGFASGYNACLLIQCPSVDMLPVC